MVKMKKTFTILVLLGAICLLSSCGNMKIVDITYTFNIALVKFPDGSTQELEISSWSDYADGDQMQITDKHGITYLFHANNIVLKTK